MTESTGITITPIANKCFGAVVNGVSLARLTDAEFATVHQAFLQYGFLVFPEQFLSEQDNVAFGERFGALEFGALPMANCHRHDDGTWGDVIAQDSQRMRTNVGNEAWHTDSTYMPVSSKCAMLSAITVPADGGETDLADMRAGYAAMEPALRARIADLSAYHSTQYSQANDIGDFPNPAPDTIYHGEAYLRPLVKVHPETGEKSLFVGRHAFGIPGLSREDSRALLQELVTFVVSDPERVYRHQWRAGDTLIWDNRCLLHRARPYDYTQPRVLLGTRVAGETDSELAYYPEDPPAAEGRRVLAAELDLLRQQHRVAAG
ncbi:MAG: TauD/TfdA family dioxygenase [Pseudomonadota bacterium]